VAAVWLWRTSVVAAVAVVAVVAACASSAQPAPSADAPVDLDRSRQMHELCAGGHGRACSLLGRAYLEGGASYAPVAKDHARALSYFTRGCEAGDLFGCYHRGRVYHLGLGVARHPARALALFERVCAEQEGDMGPSACLEAGKLYAAGDDGVARDRRRALAHFDRACAGSEPLCRYYELYAGTGRAATSRRPAGAAGFRFGISPERAQSICAARGGRIDGTDDEGALTCVGARTIPGVDGRPAAVHLRFCGAGGLCRIVGSVAVDDGEALTLYHALEGELRALYDAPSKIVHVLPSACDAAPALAACVEAGDATLATRWHWRDHHRAALAISAAGGRLDLTVDYASPAFRAESPPAR
jgi:hypothetical protein